MFCHLGDQVLVIPINYVEEKQEYEEDVAMDQHHCKAVSSSLLLRSTSPYDSWNPYREVELSP